MSDLGFHFTTPAAPERAPPDRQDPVFIPGGFSLLQTLAPAGGFRPDTRFSFDDLAPAPSPEGAPYDEPVPAFDSEEPAADPFAEAFTEGFAAGFAQASEEADARAAADRAAGEGLALSFARLDAALAERLRERLRETVELLCEGALAPLAIDADALERRIGRAVAMLARADDERTLRLHPEDLALVSPRLVAEWNVEPDPSLERGTVRVDTPGGGVEDGPATWRLAIAEALSR